MVYESTTTSASSRQSAGAERSTDGFGAVRLDGDASSEPLDTEFDGDRWEPRDPRSNRAQHPYNDTDSAEVVEEAVTTLVYLRAPMWLGDGAVTVSVLVTLASEAESHLHDAVAEARDQDYSWEEIARHLGISVSTARRRYSVHKPRHEGVR